MDETLRKLRRFIDLRFVYYVATLLALLCLPAVGAGQVATLSQPSVAPSTLSWGEDYTVSLTAVSGAEAMSTTTLTLYIEEGGIRKNIDETPYSLADEFLPLQRQVVVPMFDAMTSKVVSFQGQAGSGLIGTQTFLYCDAAQTLCTPTFKVDYIGGVASRDVNGDWEVSIINSAVLSNMCAAVREETQRVSITQADNTASYSFTDDFRSNAMLSGSISTNTYIFTAQYSTAPIFSGTRTLVIKTTFSDDDNGNGRAHWSYEADSGEICRGTYSLRYSRYSEPPTSPDSILVDIKVLPEGLVIDDSRIASSIALSPRVRDTVLSKSGELYVLHDDHTIHTIRLSGLRQPLLDASLDGSEVDIHDLVFIERDDSTNTLYLVDAFLRAVIAIDLTNGSRTVISGCDIINRCPAGQYGVGSGVSLIQPSDAVWDKAGNRLIITDTHLGALIAVDLTNGNRTVVSGCTSSQLCSDDEYNIGDGISMLHPQALDMNSSATRIVVVDDELDALFVIDVPTGDRAIASGCHRRDVCVIEPQGLGPEFDKPIAVVLDDDTDLVYVADNGLEAIIEVDLDNGNRRSLLSPVAIRTPYHLALDEDNARILVYNEADGSLTAIPQSAPLTNKQLTTFTKPPDSTASPPSSPYELKADVRADAIALSWRPVARATSYKIYWNTFDDMEAGLADQVISDIYGTSYLHTGLARGQLYYYAVSAVNEHGESGISSAATAMLPVLSGNDEIAPTLPVIVQIHASSTTAVVLDWMASVDDRSAAETIVYEVHVAESTATVVSEETKRVTVQGIYSARVDELQTSSNYYVSVAALDEAGNRSLSEMIAIRTMEAPPMISTQNEIMTIEINTELNEDGTLIIERRNDLKIGQIIIANGDGFGYLREITDIENIGNNQMRLSTKQASLKDVFENLDLNINVKLEDIDDDAAIAAAKSAEVRAARRGVQAPPDAAKLRQSSPALRFPNTAPPPSAWPYQPIYEGNEQILEMRWPDSGFRLRRAEPISQSNDVDGGVGLRSEQQPDQPRIPGTYKKTSRSGYHVFYPRHSIIEEAGEVGSFDIYIERLERRRGLCSIDSVSVEEITWRGAPLLTQGASIEAKSSDVAASILEYRLTWQTNEIFKDNEPYKIYIRVESPCGSLNFDISVYVAPDTDIKFSFEDRVTISDSENKQFNTDIKLDFSPQLEISTKQELRELKTMSVVVKGDINLDALTEIVSAKGELGGELTVYSQYFEALIPVGPVPVWVSGNMSLLVAAKATVSSEVDIKQRFQATNTIRVGFRYENGKFVPIKSRESNGEYEITITSPSTGLRTEFSIFPQLEMRLYKVAFSSVRIQPYLYSDKEFEGTYNYVKRGGSEGVIRGNSDYRFTKLDTGLGLSAGVRAGFGIFDVKDILARAPYKIFKSKLIQNPIVGSLDDLTLAWPRDGHLELFDVSGPINTLPSIDLANNGTNTYTASVEAGRWFVIGDNELQESYWSVVPSEGAPKLIELENSLSKDRECRYPNEREKNKYKCIEYNVRVDDSKTIEAGQYKLRYNGYSRYGKAIRQYEEIPIHPVTVPVLPATPLQIIKPTDGTSFKLLSGSGVSASTQVQVVIEGAEDEPVTMTLQLDNNGIVSISNRSITIAADGSKTQRTAEFALRAIGEGNTSVTIVVTDDSGNKDTVKIRVQVEAVEIPPSRGIFVDVCDRTPEVRNKIMSASGRDDCKDVTREDLASITNLSMGGNYWWSWGRDSNTLAAGDFSGLINLQGLDLSYGYLSTLPEDIFDGLSSLEWLFLDNNYLSTLPEDIFDGLSSLERLYLRDNNLSTLPEDIFDELSSLEELYLRDNNLSTLPEDVFDGLSSLEWLHLRDNNLSTLPEDIFDELSSLEFLDLGGNLSTLSEDIFDGLSSLEWLNLPYNDLSTLPEDIFDGLSSLESLDLSDNNLSTLPEDIFDGLSSLKWLYLDYNDLSTLPEDIFDGLSSLQRLYLDGNNLSTLPEDIFDGLSSLERLSLRDNNLSTLPEDIFDGLSSLERLYLVGNVIDTIEPGAFNGLSKLPRLTLSDMNLDTLKSGTFAGLSSLEWLDLVGNVIGTTATKFEIEPGAFSGLSSLERLYLRDNNLSTLPEDVFDGLSSLEGLDLRDNNLSTLPEDVFDGLSSLGWLDLSDNNLSTLPEDVFDGLSSLGWLELYYNDLSTLSEDIFDGLSSLERLDLRDNNLSTLPEDVFDGLSSLGWLDLSDNNLSTLPEDIFDGLSSLRTLYLYYNDLSTLSEDIFDGLSSLWWLDLSDNNLSTLPEDVFDGLSSLERLYLRDNNLGSTYCNALDTRLSLIYFSCD